MSAITFAVDVTVKVPAALTAGRAREDLSMGDFAQIQLRTDKLSHGASVVAYTTVSVDGEVDGENPEAVGFKIEAIVNVPDGLVAHVNPSCLALGDYAVIVPRSDKESQGVYVVAYETTDAEVACHE